MISKLKMSINFITKHTRVTPAIKGKSVGGGERGEVGKKKVGCFHVVHVVPDNSNAHPYSKS